MKKYLIATLFLVYLPFISGVNATFCSAFTGCQTTDTLPVELDPCIVGSNCQTCVHIHFHSATENKTCIWEVISRDSQQRCVSKSASLEELFSVAFDEEGCTKISANLPTTMTKSPTASNHPFCNMQKTCESCVSIRLGHGRGFCAWKPEVKECSNWNQINVIMDKFVLNWGECAAKVMNTMTPQSRSLISSNLTATNIYSEPNNEGDVAERESFPESQTDKDELDYFGEIVILRIRKIQETNPRLASVIRYKIQKILFQNEDTFSKSDIDIESKAKKQHFSFALMLFCPFHRFLMLH